MGHIFCIIDGMTDSSFQSAEYTALAGMHIARYVDTCQGLVPESLGCILHLLGVKEIPLHIRGYAEALGEGISVGPEDLIFRGSWFGIDTDGKCTVPIAGCKSISTRTDFRYYSLETYKSLLVFPNIASEIEKIETFPPYICGGRAAAELCPQGSKILETVFREQLTDSRCLILWGQSVPAKLPRFSKPAAVVSGTSVVKGIARLLGMDYIDVPGATGDTDTDLSAKVSAVLQASKSYPFVVLHINGADEAAHRKNPEEKRAFLQKVNCEVLLPLLQSENFVSVVSDHGTDPYTGEHLGTAQPLFISSKSKSDILLI